MVSYIWKGKMVLSSATTWKADLTRRNVLVWWLCVTREAAGTGEVSLPTLSYPRIWGWDLENGRAVVEKGHETRKPGVAFLYVKKIEHRHQQTLWINVGMRTGRLCLSSREVVWCPSLWAVCRALLSGDAVAPHFFIFLSPTAKEVLQEFQVSAQGRICQCIKWVLVLLFSSAPLSSGTSLWLWQNEFVLLSPFQSCY